MSGTSFLLVEESTQTGGRAKEPLNMAIGKQLENNGM